MAKETTNDKYRVLVYWEDLEDGNKEYEEGQIFPRPANKKVSAERLKELSSTDNRRGIKLIEKITDEPEAKKTEEE